MRATIQRSRRRLCGILDSYPVFALAVVTLCAVVRHVVEPCAFNALLLPLLLSAHAGSLRRSRHHLRRSSRRLLSHTLRRRRPTRMRPLRLSPLPPCRGASARHHMLSLIHTHTTSLSAASSRHLPVSSRLMIQSIGPTLLCSAGDRWGTVSVAAVGTTSEGPLPLSSATEGLRPRSSAQVAATGQLRQWRETARRGLRRRRPPEAEAEGTQSRRMRRPPRF